EGKSGFLKEFFVDHPGARKDEIDRAWREAGNGGTISESLISKVRSGLGLKGKRRGTARAKGSTGAGKRSSAAPKSKGGRTGPKAAGGTAAKANGRLVTGAPGRPAERRTGGDNRTRVFVRVEGQIDGMLHEVGLAGGAPELA